MRRFMQCHVIPRNSMRFNVISCDLIKFRVNPCNFGSLVVPSASAASLQLLPVGRRRTPSRALCSSHAASTVSESSRTLPLALELE